MPPTVVTTDKPGGRGVNGRLGNQNQHFPPAVKSSLPSPGTCIIFNIVSSCLACPVRRACKIPITGDFFCFRHWPSGWRCPELRNGYSDWRSRSSTAPPLAFAILNQPNRHIPVLFIHRQQVVCHADHASGPNLGLQSLHAPKSRLPGDRFKHFKILNSCLSG